MILSTSTNLYCERPDGRVLPIEQTLTAASKAGFQTFDMSFYEYSFPGSQFLTEDWQAWAQTICNTAQKQNLRFHQCHAYTYDFLDPTLTEQQRRRQEQLVFRSIDCCAMLGAKVLVTHVSTGSRLNCSGQQMEEYNRRYLRSIMDYAAERGMKVAAENQYSAQAKPTEIFYASPEQIVEFVNSFEDDRLGVCWDFEHGAIMELDQGAAVRTLGKHLLATHVSDTVSKTFEPYMHVMPFTGMLDWRPIMKALKEIGYEGAFSFEAHNFLKKLPDELTQPALAFSYQIGTYLMNLAE